MSLRALAFGPLPKSQVQASQRLSLPTAGGGNVSGFDAGGQDPGYDAALTVGGPLRELLLDMNGRAQPNVRVQIYERRLVNGERKLLPVAGSTGGASGSTLSTEGRRLRSVVDGVAVRA